jgi:four helix bundle protein
MFRFESLDIWRLGIEYSLECYKKAASFPQIEQFALADQLRRSAVSVPTNIAEGTGGTEKEFCSFLNIAVKSCLETVSLLIVAERLKYITMDERLDLYSKAETLVRKTRALRNLYINRKDANS